MSPLALGSFLLTTDPPLPWLGTLRLAVEGWGGFGALRLRSLHGESIFLLRQLGP